MDVRLGDILVMKKEHPCGDKRWLVLRTGMDFRLRCLGCGHEVMLPRAKAENSFSMMSARVAGVPRPPPMYSFMARSAMYLEGFSMADSSDASV